MPIFDLHLHLEGAHPTSALFDAGGSKNPPVFKSEAEVVKECVATRGELTAMPSDDARRVRFIAAMDKTRQVYTSPQAVQTLTLKTCDAAALQAPDGFELRFSLYSMVKSFIRATGGEPPIDQRTVREVEDLGRSLLCAVIAGANDSGKPVRLRFGLSRNVPGPQAGNQLGQYVAVAQLALEDSFTKALCGLDLLGFAATGYAEPYPQQVLDLIEQLRPSLPDLVVHAGEVFMGDAAAPVASIRKALALKPNAIGHGIWAASDPALIAECVKQKIVFEVCPMSNQLLNKDGLARLVSLCGGRPPLKVLHEHGIQCVISSDDPATFGTTLTEDRRYAADLGLDIAEFDRVAETRWNALPAPTF